MYIVDFINQISFRDIQPNDIFLDTSLTTSLFQIDNTILPDMHINRINALIQICKKVPAMSTLAIASIINKYYNNTYA